jgi:hypothetical protein
LILPPAGTRARTGVWGVGAGLRTDDAAQLTHLAAALKVLRAGGMLPTIAPTRLVYDTARDGLRGHCGLDITAAARGPALAQLFGEEPGVVIQVMAGYEPLLGQILARHGLGGGAVPGPRR